MKNIWDNEKLIEVLKEGGVVVMPTDTIYGIVGSALNKDTVLRIYDIKRRAPEKPCIILISDIKELEKFSIELLEEQKKILEKYWLAPSEAEGSEPVSIILDCFDDSLGYLHRGIKTLAFRLPRNTDLQNLLKKEGPLIAPSANIEGSTPAEDIFKAKDYFGDLVDLYIDEGRIVGKSSKLIQLHKDGSVSILRE